MEKIKALIASGVAGFFSCFGLMAVPILLLVGSNVVDYVTAIMASKYHDETVSSKKSYRGIFKKVSMYILVFVGFAMDCLVVYMADMLEWVYPFAGLIACIVTVWLVLNELISIAENCRRMDVDVPFLRPLLNLVKTKVEEKGTIDF